jgi:hypothetical protein
MDELTVAPMATIRGSVTGKVRPEPTIGEVRSCSRLRGQSAYFCPCRHLEGDGWEDCPVSARGILLAVYREPEYALNEPHAEPAARAPDRSTARSVALSQGYTGNFCDDCGGARMTRSGTCEKCEDCGSTSGCS